MTTWRPLRYIDAEKWAGVGILVWVPKQRTVYAAYLDAFGVLRVWNQSDGPNDVIEGATQWRQMVGGPRPRRRVKDQQ